MNESDTLDPANEQIGADDGGPPFGSAWTFVVEGDDGWSADLEHVAPLPRVGERVEFIAEDGTRGLYRVSQVVHTLQSSASERPRVREEQSLPNTLVSNGGDRGTPRELRAGLPRVIAVPDDQP